MCLSFFDMTARGTELDLLALPTIAGYDSGGSQAKSRANSPLDM